MHRCRVSVAYRGPKWLRPVLDAADIRWFERVIKIEIPRERDKQPPDLLAVLDGFKHVETRNEGTFTHSL